MKRSHKSAGGNSPLRVHAPKRLVYDRGQWHIDTTRGKKSSKSVPFDLPIDTFTYLLRGTTDTLECCLAVEDQILTAVYENLAVGLDVLQSAQSSIIYALAENVHTSVAYEDSIRITVKIVFGRKLPYECEQDHSSMSADMCSDCGMTVASFAVIRAFEDQASEFAQSGLFKGLRVNLDIALEDTRVASPDLPPVTSGLAPLTIERVEE